MPKFLLKFNAAVIKEIPITKDSLTVGRKDDNDIVIDNPAVSGHHAKITLAGDTFFVEDLESTNGVFVNEKKVMKAGLKNNDVIGIVKHALVFVDDRGHQAPPAEAAAPARDSAAEKTMMITAERQQEMASAASQAAQKKPAVIRVVKGVVDKPEYELRDPSTYIGKSERVTIKIKGAGMFGKAPENAAMIAARADGYYLVPIEEGYTKLNGKTISQKELLKDGDQIELGGTTLQFTSQP
jgi:pSer/pThr/pTyr-binding forkhead associated (FHA) protein